MRIRFVPAFAANTNGFAETAKPVVVIIDYQTLFGETLADLLSREAGLEAHFAPTSDLTLDAFSQEPRPDVVLMRLGPDSGLGSLSLMRAILACGGAKVVLHDDQLMGCDIETALMCGVAGIIAANTPPRSLAAILTLVARGEIYVPQYYIRQSLDRMLGRKPGQRHRGILWDRA